MPMRVAASLFMLLCFAFLPTAAAAASPPRASLTAAVRDTDSSGDTTCGDLIDYTLSIFPSNQDSPADVHFELFIDPRLVYLPASLNASSTNGATILINDPDHILIDFGSLGTAFATWTAGIGAPNTGSVIVQQGEVTGSNFDATLTDADDDPTLNPTLVYFDPCPPNPLNADLALTKTDGGITATPGQTVVYTLSVLNLGPSAATDTVLVDNVPSGSSFDPAASSPGWTCAGSACQIPVGTLAFGATATRLFAVTIPPSTSATSITNTAQATTSRTDPNSANNQATDNTPIDLGAPDLRLSKSVASGSAEPGGTLVYALNLLNAGNRTASGTVLSETVPADTTFAPAASTPGWACSPPAGGPGASCSLSIGDLAPGATLSRAFAVTIANPLPSSTTSILNAACSSTPTPGDPSADNCATITTPTSGSPQLSISKTDGGISAEPGDIVVYTLSYSNLGPGNAPGTTLTEVVPAHTTFSPASSSPGWSCSPASGGPGATCTLSHGALVAGGSSTKLFAVTVGTVPPGVTSTTNTTSISSSAPDSDTSDNTASDTTPLSQGSPDLDLTKTASSGTGDPGSTLVYQLTAINAGNGPAASVTLSETVPLNTTFAVAASSPGWSCSPDSSAGSTCTLALGTLAGGGTSVVRNFAVTIDNPLAADVAAIFNVACVATTTPGDPDQDNCDTFTTPATGTPNLSLAKSLSSGSATPGSTLAFLLTLTNSGNQGVSSTTFTETVPTNTSFAPAQSSPGWNCTPDGAAGSTCSLSAGPLAAGASTSRTFAVVVDNPLPAGVTSISNSACATSVGTSSCDDIEVPTSGAPLLSLSKSLSSGSGVPGTVLTYAIAVQNTGNQAAASVVLTETVPLHTTYEASASSPGWSCSPNGSPGSTCTLTLGTLAGNGATATRNFAVRIVDPLPAQVTSIANEACASFPQTAPACDDLTVPPTASPLLQILKSLRSAVAPGSPVLYALSISNTGNQHASGVIVTDQVPAFTSFNPAASSPGWTCTPNSSAGSACSLLIGTLSAGESREVLFAVDLVSPLPSEAVSLTNLACITDNAGLSACSDITSPISAGPALVFTKVAPPDPLAPGQLVSFSLHVVNNGNRTAADVVLSETVPQSSTFSPQASSQGWTCSSPSPGSACSYPIGDLVPGQAASATFTVVAPDPLPPGVVQIANSACASDENGSTACDDATTPLLAQVDAKLIDSLHTDTNGDGFPSPGEVLAYTLLVTNPSSLSLSDLVITTALDAHLSFIPGSVTTSHGSAVDAQAPTVSVPALAPLETVTITFLAEVLDLPPGLDHLSSQGTVSGSNFASEPTDDPDTATLDDDPTLTPLTRSSRPIVDIPTLSDIGLFGLIAVLTVLAVMRLRT